MARRRRARAGLWRTAGAPTVAFAVGSALAAAPATAQPAPEATPAAYVVAVGSNLAGPGQQPLQHAHADAERFVDVLVELGGYDPSRVVTLTDPAPEDVLGAIDALADRIAVGRDAGERSVATFYYSGHARADALDLGGRALPLADLRAALTAVGSTLTLVVLDACQAGALSRVKGIDVAPEFSTNSVSGLRTEGLAVLASSTASELSQESDALGGSTFTHHLVTGLRGAADVQGDGAVTLDEAYAYAYDRTLVATAQTAVGSQHPTLETDLRGQGATVLTWPSRASAGLELAETLQADLVVQQEDSGVVVAEVHKAPGPMRLALVPGPYAAVMRRSDGSVARCTFALADGTDLRLTDAGGPDVVCEDAPVGAAAPKASVAEITDIEPDPDRRVPPMTPWSLELGGGVASHHDDNYVRRLEDFGYAPPWRIAGISASASARLMRNLGRGASLGLLWGTLDVRSFVRPRVGIGGDLEDVRYSWTVHRVGPAVRLATEQVSGIVVLYAEVGGGLTFTTSTLDGETDGAFGAQFGGGVGIAVMPPVSRRRGFGVFTSVEGVYAPALRNLLGDTHDAGGVVVATGLRVGF